MQTPLNDLAGRYSHTNLVVERARGATVVTGQGAQFVDFVLGNLTQIFGHGGLNAGPALMAMLDRLTNVGDQPTSFVAPVAESLLRISGKDSVRFTNSGSEAVHLAVRLARAATGRRLLVKFEGHYHGWFDEQIATFLPDSPTAGIPASTTENVLVLSWNDRAAVASAFERHGRDIAAVICEPVLVHSGTIPPFDGFLSFLRQVTREHRALLIFDECVTGFRLALGGAQEHFDVAADLVAYSKALSNGFPLGAVCGTTEAMEPAASGRIFHASTYDCNPFAMVMAKLVLDRLSSSRDLQVLHENGTKLAEGLKNVFELTGHDVVVQSCGAFFQFFFTSKPAVTNYREAVDTDYEKYRRFVRGMLREGVIVSEGDLQADSRLRRWIGSWFVSCAHEDAVIARVINAATVVARRDL